MSAVTLIDVIRPIRVTKDIQKTSTERQDTTLTKVLGQYILHSDKKVHKEFHLQILKAIESDISESCLLKKPSIR